MKVAVRSTIPYQVPAFVAEDNPLFIDFLDAYYEWLEQEGNSVDYVRNALTFLDVDQTLDKFVNYFWEEVRDIPLEAKANRRLLAKHIYDLYQSKGTIKSYKLLFRILYGEDVEVYTPKNDMLRVSDGKWETNHTIRSTTVDGDPFGLIGLTLRQTDPNATVLVQNVVKYSYGSDDYYDIQIEPGSNVGTLRPNENAFANWTDADGNEQTITVFLPISPTTLTIRSKGKYHDAGWLVSLIDTTGTDFDARIGEIGAGTISGIMILDGGVGYVVGDNLSVDNTNTAGVGLSATVSRVDSTGAVTALRITNSGQAYNSLPVVTGAKGGKFLPYSDNIGRVLSVNTASVGRNHPDQTVETSILTRGIITNPSGAFQIGESLTLLGDCILNENYGTFLAEDGSRILNEDVNNQTTPATISNVDGNNIELNGQTTRRAIGLETGGYFLAEDGSIVINELSSADLNRRTIVGATSGTMCRILDMDSADVLFGPGVLALTGSRFKNLDGKISEYTKRIQDSKFYQDFSYVIKSSQSLETYKNVVQKLVHPAGFAMFGEVHVETKLKIGLRVIQQLNNLVNLETYISMGFGPGGTGLRIGFTLKPQGISNDYESLDNWKFPAVGSKADPIYQSNSIIANFSNLTFNAIYQYDSSGKVVGYNESSNSFTRGAEIRVNGTLI